MAEDNEDLIRAIRQMIAASAALQSALAANAAVLSECVIRLEDGEDPVAIIRSAPGAQGRANVQAASEALDEARTRFRMLLIASCMVGGMSRKELASNMGFSPQLVSRYVRAGRGAGLTVRVVGRRRSAADSGVHRTRSPAAYSGRIRPDDHLEAHVRTRRTQPGVRAAAAAVVALLTAACGGGAAPPMTTAAPSSTSPPTSVPAAASGPLRFGPPVPLSHGAGLAAVSCGSAASCLAMDSAGRAYDFDGASWSGPVPPDPQPIGPGAVAVSCAGATPCAAVATAGNQIVTWDGHSWSAPVTVVGAVGLGAVGCAPTGYCASVDSEGNAFAADGATWHATAGDWGSVSAISCVSATFCVSVSGGISQWDGGRWSTPDPLTSTSAYSGVSCPATTFCTAVDQGGEALQWDGRAWSAATRIEPGAVSATSSGVALTGVSCPTSTFCAAVDAGGGVLQWSNGAWTRDDADGSVALEAISCPTTDLCVAVDQEGRVLLGRP